MVRLRYSLLLVSVAVNGALAVYRQIQDYSGNTFFDEWDFFTNKDPTQGFVKFQSRDAAQQQGLIGVQPNDNSTITPQAFIGVDSTNVAPSGRHSVRIESRATFDHGLFILDLEHAPGGVCGTWPSFWMLGPNWPNNGEIDIVEGVNDDTTNGMTLHTNTGVSLAKTNHTRKFTGILQSPNCDVNARNQPDNAGCSIRDDSDLSFGTGFNNAGGGVYATEWTSRAIKIWFFSRAQIPADVLSDRPDPRNPSWGLPQSNFAGNFDIDRHFRNMTLIFDTTFCGTFAGAVFSQSPTCASKAATCDDFVANNPAAFSEAYWLINSLKVFSDNGESSSPGSTTPGATTVPATTAGVCSSRTLAMTRTRRTTVDGETSTFAWMTRGPLQTQTFIA